MHMHTRQGVLNNVWGLREEVKKGLGVERGRTVIVQSHRTLEVGAVATRHENTFPCALLRLMISIS